jgi:ABC-type transporter Mla subunit MlaD
MNVVRNEIRTGILAVLTLAILVTVLVYLGAPGAFTPQKDFSIYFDNAAGLKKGTQVMLAGRKVGQVVEIVSPVPVAERPVPATEKDAPLEVRVGVRVERDAQIYRVVKVRLASYGVLDEAVIDFTGGEEASGLAENGMHFVGERPGGLADTGTAIIEKLDPAVNQLVSTLKSLDATATNVTKMTEPEADLAKTFAEFRELGRNLTSMTGPDGAIQRALAGIERLTKQDGELSGAVADFRKLIGPDSDLAKAVANAEKFTGDLANSTEIQTTLKNFKAASARLNSTLSDLQGDLGATAKNLSQGSDLLKRQPWRLIWPTTKKYPEEKSPEEEAQRRPVQKGKRPLFRASVRSDRG